MISARAIKGVGKEYRNGGFSGGVTGSWKEDSDVPTLEMEQSATR